MKEKLKLVICNFKFFLRNIILLESNPDFSDNTKAVFDELINQRINKKYKIIWLVKDKNQFKDIKIKNVFFMNGKNSEKNGFKLKLVRYFSKYIIDCNYYLHKFNKYQFRIHLTHGEPIKVARDYCSGCGEVDCLIQTGEAFIDIMSSAYKVPKNKIMITGYPRNDSFFQKSKDVLFLKNYKYEKFVLWLPTYRNHLNQVKRKEKKFLYGVPSINSKEDLLELNGFLSKNKILLGIKLHPAENKKGLKEKNLSNILFIENEYLANNNLDVSDILKKADALITDYSSTYYDYLLLNRPIGMAIEDIKEYKKYNELFYENFEENLPAEYIYNFKNLKSFLKKVSAGKDNLKEERQKAIKKFHKYVDGNSSKRVVKIITDHMKGK